MSSRTAPAYPAIHITGDSFTGGLYATTGNNYRTLLQPLLQGANAANAGSYTQWAITGGKMADQVGSEAVVFPACNLLIVALGQNDVPSRSVEQFQADTISCFSYIATYLTCAVIVVAIPFGPYWHGTATGAKGLQFNAVLKAQAESRGFYWAPSWEIALTWAGIAQASDVPLQATAADSYHPNNFGHQQLLAALWKDAQPLVSRAMRRPASAGHSQASGRSQATGRVTA